ncbi:MAG: hypothetical protein EXR39_09875 [Betaproteobacteria bacterium]|nr:hypothetical protein [Betaproteobacteria bacterium]
MLRSIRPGRFVSSFPPAPVVHRISLPASSHRTFRSRSARPSSWITVPVAAALWGVQKFLRAPADGYTFFMPDSSQWAVLPALRSQLPYDTLKDFAPVGLVFTSTLFIVALDTFPANSVGDFITLARANPGSQQIASIGTSGLLNIFAETFKASLGLDMTYVPNKGGADLMAALLRGEVSVAVISTASISSYVKTGRMRLLAAGSKVRAKFAPDVPTIAEAAGLSDFYFAGQWGWWGDPARHSPSLKDYLLYSSRPRYNRISQPRQPRLASR